MLSVIELYDDCADQINVQENGQFDYDTYNRFSWRAQLRLMDWISGDISGRVPPEPYLTQKNADWLTPFIVSLPANVENGILERPNDYYLWQKGTLLRGEFEDCDDNDAIDIPDNSITLLAIDKFEKKSNTNIKLLQPTYDKPIAQQVGNNFEFYPKDIGSIKLYYVRYPVRATLVSKLDTVFNQQVPDAANSINFEWDEKARELLVWFIVDLVSNRNREQALKQFNISTGKTVREGK